MKKIRISLQLAQQCWKVLLLDSELLVFPVLSAAALLLVVASFFVPLWSSGALEQAAEHKNLAQDPVLIAAYLAFYLVSYFVIIFFNTALIACAMIRLRGGNPTVGDGLRAASERLPAILGWSGLSALVGLIIQAIEERVGLIGKLVVGFIGLSWAIASYFVIPTIVVENIGPVDALKRSAALIKKTWGEALTVQVGLSLLSFGAGLVAVLAIVAGSAIAPTNSILGGSVMVLGLVGFLAGIVVTATLQAILTAALYLYAADGRVPGNFDNELLKNAFAPR